MYNPRRRNYYSKKYYRNRLFAPAMLKANMPNYYQMKGRIIQQTPAHVQNAVTKMITRDDLDKYYKLLLEYKYPIPNAPDPAIDFNLFTYNIRTPQMPVVNLPEQIDLTYIYNNYVQSQLVNLPNPPTNYEYGFQLTSIRVSQSGSAVADTSRFSFTWNSSLSSAPVSLISKTLDSTINNTFDAEIFVVPSNGTLFRASQIAFAATSIIYHFTNFNSTDRIITDDPFYPLMVSVPTAETTDGVIAITQEGPAINTFITLNISIFLHSTDF